MRHNDRHDEPQNGGLFKSYVGKKVFRDEDSGVVYATGRVFEEASLALLRSSTGGFIVSSMPDSRDREQRADGSDMIRIRIRGWRGGTTPRKT